jgi:hypothetical protein
MIRAGGFHFAAHGTNGRLSARQISSIPWQCGLRVTVLRCNLAYSCRREFESPKGKLSSFSRWRICWTAKKIPRKAEKEDEEGFVGRVWFAGIRVRTGGCC